MVFGLTERAFAPLYHPFIIQYFFDFDEVSLNHYILHKVLSSIYGLIVQESDGNEAYWNSHEVLSIGGR